MASDNGIRATRLPVHACHIWRGERTYLLTYLWWGEQPPAPSASTGLKVSSVILMERMLPTEQVTSTPFVWWKMLTTPCQWKSKGLLEQLSQRLGDHRTCTFHVCTGLRSLTEIIYHEIRDLSQLPDIWVVIWLIIFYFSLILINLRVTGIRTFVPWDSLLLKYK